MSGPSSPEPLHMNVMPLGSKQEIGIDFMTDYYSRYIKISIFTRHTAKVAISSLSKMVAIYGFPYTVTRDTSSHFMAESFDTFLKDNGIKYLKTTPLWPRPMVRLKAKKR